MRNQKGLTHILLLFIVVTAISGIIGFSLGKKTVNKPTQNSQPESQETIPPIKDENDRMLRSFLNDTYSQYPKLQSQVSKDKIKKVFPLSLKGSGQQLQQGWIVEATSNSQQYTPESVYYLLTPILEKEFTDATSTVSDDKSGSCTLDNVKVVYSGSNNYVILSSKQCSGYGTAGSGSTSVYKLPSGDKVKLQGSFTVPNMPSFWTGVSISGNALGIFRDVHGVTQPMVVIDYSSSEGVVLTAYFDLHSGKLDQLIKFE